MDRCPTCRAPLPEGLQFCPPTDTMGDGGDGIRIRDKYEFAGCEALRIENTKRSAWARSGNRSARQCKKQRSDFERFTAAYGTDCTMSEYGPLPMEREIRGRLIWEGRSYWSKDGAEHAEGLGNG